MGRGGSWEGETIILRISQSLDNSESKQNIVSCIKLISKCELMSMRWDAQNTGGGCGMREEDRPYHTDVFQVFEPVTP